MSVGNAKHLEEEDWHDIDSSGNVVSPSPLRPSTPTSTRKRKLGKTVFEASPKGSSRRSSSTRKDMARGAYRTESSTPPVATSDPFDNLPAQSAEALQAGAVETAAYARDVVGLVIRYSGTLLSLAKKPLAIAIIIWGIAFFVNSSLQQVRVAIAPLCKIPIISSIPVCTFLGPPSSSTDSDGNPHQPPKWANFARLSELQGKSFEQLMDEAAGGSALAVEIKRAELASKDLATIVRVSKLTSRDAVAGLIDDFVGDAKKASERLQKFNAKVNGAVDIIMAINEYSLNAIEEARAKSSFSVLSLIPWVADASQQVILKRFDDAMATLTDQMTRLILEAEASLRSLDALESRLDTLHELLTREGTSFSAQRDELLALLWTKLGGNKRKLRSFDQHLHLLTDLGEYRRRSLAHVVAALQALQGMNADMEDLRERVAAPPLLGDHVPPEVHMRSIQSGLERLKEGRVRAKSLEEATILRLLEESDNYVGIGA